ncbi:hypothetical protein CL655_02035 [bacterium]|nr:hypothetical protein [bacterium]|tara:strand:- start:1614 stop:2522 length:909 start_codon:yes stop_codon:yes gene_type:complete
MSHAEPMVQPDFIAMVDEKYSLPLFTSIKQSLKYYPHSHFYVYDCGLEQSTVAELTVISPQVHVIQWTLEYLPITVGYDRAFVRMKALGMLRDVVKSYFTGTFVNKSLRSFERQQRFEVVIQNKLRVMQHHNETVGRPFIFIDADAFLIDRIDELLDGSYDVGFTVRPKTKHSYAYNRCALLFAGIMWFMGNQKTNQIFFDQWFSEARQCTELWSEQTSLARWLHRLQPDIFDTIGATHTITIHNTPVRIRTLDADVYNNTHIDEYEKTAVPENVKVLHFKNNRFTTPQFATIAKQLNIETR